jgi:sulfoxide reductase heme-binding subunit YedZ
MAWSKVPLRSWLQSNWRWALLNLGALVILIYVLTQGTEDWRGEESSFVPMLENGKWAVRFLLLSLLMTPLATYLQWKYALKLRKPAGLWAFAFGLAHFVYYAAETWQPDGLYPPTPTPWHWLVWPMQSYIALGLVALAILSVLAMTSNKWSMRHLGKNWKRLHRLVYCVGVIAIIHGLVASTMSKRMMVRDPLAERELYTYMGILAILLIVRIPFVRTHLLKRLTHTTGETKRKTPVVVPAIPTPLPTRTYTQLPQPSSLPLPKPEVAPDKRSDESPDRMREPERAIVH